MRQNEAGENFTTVALAGVHDSDAITLPDNLLEATGTYALCHAEYIPGNYSDCLTWHPHGDNFTFHPLVQLVRYQHFKPHTHALVLT